MMLDVLKRALTITSLLPILAVTAWAQLQVGDDVSMSLNGNIGFSYNGSYSNDGPSAHSLSPNGSADLNGYYYSPQFLNFNVQPYYSRDQANATSQSIFQNVGVNSSASLFSGSHFPGSISYNRAFNSQGIFAQPGVGDFTTHGDNSTFSLGWGIQVPEYPTVSFRFSDGSINDSVLGSNSDASLHTKTFTVSSAYTIAGFNLGGGYSHNTSHSLVPEFLSGKPAQLSDTSSNSYNFNISHAIPLHGAITAGASRSLISSESSGDKFNATVDGVNAGISIAPVRNLDLGTNMQYTNNLNGFLYQSLITNGALPQSSLVNLSSVSTHSRDINSHASYTLPSLHLMFMVIEDHITQNVSGGTISGDTVNEMVNYGNDFFGGFLNETANFSQTKVNSHQDSHSSGFTDTITYSRKVQRWNLTGRFNYSHDTQTVLVGYTSSGWGFGGGIGRKLSRYSYVSLNANRSKSTFNTVAGSDNSTQNYSGSYSMRLFSLSGSYSKAHGTSIVTSEGLVPVTNPIPNVFPFQTLVFNGTSYSAGASTSPKRGLILSGSYSHSRSNTLGGTADSRNSSAQLNTLVQYRVRQLWLQAGYIKVQQGFTITGLRATSDSAFWVGISRWFNFF